MASGDFKLDAQLRAVTVPSGLLERLLALPYADDAGLDEAVRDVVLPEGLSQRLAAIPLADDEGLDEALRDVPVPYELQIILPAAWAPRGCARQGPAHGPDSAHQPHRHGNVADRRRDAQFRQRNAFIVASQSSGHERFGNVGCEEARPRRRRGKNRRWRHRLGSIVDDDADTRVWHMESQGRLKAGLRRTPGNRFWRRSNRPPIAQRGRNCSSLVRLPARDRSFGRCAQPGLEGSPNSGDWDNLPELPCAADKFNAAWT